MLIRELQRGKCLLASLDHGADLVSQISELARIEGIQTGVFSALGALTQAKLAFYDQESHEYDELLLTEPVELVSCSGNISIRDGKPFVHAHAVLAGSEGETSGGHLLYGKIFAAELYLVELSGDPMVREHDPLTGLYLWSK